MRRIHHTAAQARLANHRQVAAVRCWTCCRRSKRGVLSFLRRRYEYNLQKPLLDGRTRGYILVTSSAHYCCSPSMRPGCTKHRGRRALMVIETRYRCAEERATKPHKLLLRSVLEIKPCWALGCCCPRPSAPCHCYRSVQAFVRL